MNKFKQALFAGVAANSLAVANAPGFVGNSGGVGKAGLTESYDLYLVGWEWLEMGSAAAVSWILFVFIAIATSVHFWFNGRKGLEGNR